MFAPPVVAIDTGTAVTRLATGTSGVIERPSRISEVIDGEVIERPVMRAGVVSDIAGLASVLSSMFAERQSLWRRKMTAIVCTPSNATAEEKEALVEAVTVAGASVSAVVPEPLAAAIGSGVDIGSSYATAILDIGEGVTDFAVIREGVLVHSEALRVGCGTLREAIRDWLQFQHDLTVDDSTAEAVVRAYVADGPHGIRVPRRLRSDLHFERDEIGTIIDPEIDAIASFADGALRRLSHSIATEVIESGVFLAGGGARHELLVRRIDEKIGMATTRRTEPLTAVIRGAREMLRDRKLLRA
jgi:rod shape-determining protein MreB